MTFHFLSPAPTGLSPPHLHPVNKTTIQINWDPPAQLNGPHPLYQVSIDRHSVVWIVCGWRSNFSQFGILKTSSVTYDPQISKAWQLKESLHSYQTLWGLWFGVIFPNNTNSFYIVPPGGEDRCVSLWPTRSCCQRNQVLRERLSPVSQFHSSNQHWLYW